MLLDIKMEKSIAELGHNDRLKFYVDPKKITSTLVFKYTSPNSLVYFAEILYGV